MIHKRWANRCDLCYGNRFETKNGTFVVVGIQFDKQHNRSGLFICSKKNLGHGESVFIDEKELIKMELENKFKIL